MTPNTDDAVMDTFVQKRSEAHLEADLYGDGNEAKLTGTTTTIYFHLTELSLISREKIWKVT